MQSQGSGSQSIGQRSQMSKPVAVGAGDDQSIQSAFKKKMQDKAQAEANNLWQHPYVDVLKHFKLLPGNDWKQNKKAGEVEEYFAKEIGRRAFNISGTISSNNYVMMPSPSSHIKSLGLNGRYVYFQVKCAKHGLPFSYHIDLAMAERSHGVRISISNLFKNFNTSNGFVAQVPLELRNNCWSVVVIDIYEILKQSDILPSTYLIEGSYAARSITVCANTHLRGIFTSDNLYDFVTLPADMRFKFAFDLASWPDYFHWQNLPHDWGSKRDKDENTNLQALITKNQTEKQQTKTREETREEMRREIDNIIQNNKMESASSTQIDLKERERQEKYEAMQQALSLQYNKGPADHPVGGIPAGGDDSGARAYDNNYRTGQFIGQEQNKSHKLQKDPIMELRHIIGYQPEKCKSLKWSRQEGENVVIFTSGGTLIAMDTETNEQKRFFFGHSAAISCFDINPQGTMLASAQEGSNAIVRIWEYISARIISFTLMPVQIVKCLTFSHDGRYLAACGKDGQKDNSRELIVIYDISRIMRGEKPELVAKQTSEFNILCLKFSPIDNTRLCSCGKENIRFWRIRDQGNIRGSAVVLNHHARNTVFTCLDFEHGFSASDKEQDEAMKRVFVGTKNGMVYQINYAKETHENQFKTNDAAIHSIAVNDAFCVTGSEDSFLRVWPLDFQEFFMEAQHEGTVNSVDISQDGLKVVCGTMYGSIGILDKSNQAYKTLLRSHTNNILAIDFHVPKQNIISISEDKTIRLWSTESMDEVYEFSSPYEQPLSISAHPHEPIFACGFNSGRMRIFNIDSTEVIEDFSQFDKPLQSLRYDNTGKLLIACCIDGNIAIHNALRQHLPVKMMKLQFPSEFVHVAISDRIMSDPDCLNQKFGLMGEYGNNINIYDTDAFLIQHQISVNQIVRSFKFANQNQDLVVVTKDCRIKFYSMYKFEGIFLREVANCHRSCIQSLAITHNAQYFLTGGEDNLIKIWDYEAQRTHPFFFQSFIGHTYPISSVLFNPRNNNQIITVGLQDGIFIWDFNGDVGDSNIAQEYLAGQDLTSSQKQDQFGSKGAVAEFQMSKLEKIRTTNKAKKQYRNQMSPDSFIIPEFVNIDFVIEKSDKDKKDEDYMFYTPNAIQNVRQEMKVGYNHYLYLGDELTKFKPQPKEKESYGRIQDNIIDQKLINGYDGFAGVHDNLVWNVNAGMTYFTLNNKLIIENTKTREQTILCDSKVRISTMAVSADFKYIAVGEGQNSGEASQIYLYVTETKKMQKKFGFHQKGIQSLSFTPGNKYLVTLGVKDGGMIALWDLNNSDIAGIPIECYGTYNQVKADPYYDGDDCQFFAVGNHGILSRYIYSASENVIRIMDVPVKPKLKPCNFLCLEFTPRLPEPTDSQIILIGTHDGKLISYQYGPAGEQGEYSQDDFINLGIGCSDVLETDSQIGVISIKNNTIIFCTNDGEVGRYQIRGDLVYPTMEDDNYIDWIEYGDKPSGNSKRLPAAVVSASFDLENKEGLIGTEEGQVFYVNFEEKISIRLITSTNPHMDEVATCKFDPGNSNLIISSSGQNSEQFKIYSTQNLDMVKNFTSDFEEFGHVVFVISPKTQNKKKFKIVGFSKGFIKRVSFERLKVQDVCSLNLNSQERITCGVYSENDYNIVIGSNIGNVYIVSMKINKQKINQTTTYCVIQNICKSNPQYMSKGDKLQKQINLDLDEQQTSQSLELELDDVSRDDSQAGLDNFIGVTSIAFPSQDPIGTMVVAFDNGEIKVWESVVKNEQLWKILELKQQNEQKDKDQRRGPVIYDISAVGYQQFDLIDTCDLFFNPSDVKSDEYDPQIDFDLYKGKKYPNTVAQFAPDRSYLENCYFAYTDKLQCIYVRDYRAQKKLMRISLKHFPLCMKIVEASNIKIDNEDSKYQEMFKKGKNNHLLLLFIGTEEGKVLIHKVGGATSQSNSNLFRTKAGIAYGGISSIDVTSSGSEFIATTQSGEMIQYDLLKKLNEDQIVQF